MDTLSRAPSTAGRSVYPDAGWGPQPRTPDDPQSPKEEVDEPPIRILPNGYILQFANMEDRVEMPTWRQFHPINHWQDLLCDGEGSNPPSLNFGWQAGTIIFDMLCSKDYFITHIVFHRPAWAIYYYSHWLLGKHQIGLCLNQGRLHPFKCDLHNFIRCHGKSIRH